MQVQLTPEITQLVLSTLTKYHLNFESITKIVEKCEIHIEENVYTFNFSELYFKDAEHVVKLLPNVNWKRRFIKSCLDIDNVFYISAFYNQDGLFAFGMVIPK